MLVCWCPKDIDVSDATPVLRLINYKDAVLPV